MAVDSETVQRLIDQLSKDRQVFIDSTNRTHELLQQTLLSLKSLSDRQSSSSQPLPPSQAPTLAPAALVPLQTGRRGSVAIGHVPTRAAQRTTTADIEVESIPKDKSPSAYTGDTDSDSDDNESIFVQTPLQPEQYDMEGLRNHLKEHQWTDAGKAIIDDLQEDHYALGRDCIFPVSQAEAEMDRSHLSHYSIYDVGYDGVPLDIKHSGEKPPTRALEIWDRVRSINTNPEKRPAAGRIVIVREPSPKLFAALHYTMNKHFDMDELFSLLNDEDPGLMFPHRAFDKDPRHRRTFVITMEYFTIIGDMCKPMKWQRSDEEGPDTKLENHIPISRCSSVIALSLEGVPMTKVKNRDRRIHDKYGDVFDPFSPWRVLSIQAYPDWHATTDTHKPTTHYVNGPEAFLYTVEAEFNDARKRLKEVYNRVGELVEPPPNFIFNSKVREALLFEDDKFTYSKKYFWAYQTLSIINQDITEMIESYRDTFRDSVWEGSNKIIWPGGSSMSSRYQQWRKRMAKLRQAMDDEVEKLEYIKSMNFKKMQDIEALRENLFSGTSVMESRRSVQQTFVTIEQNRTVLLLTLVTIFFLPLTFVTSVFGMTNMNPAESYMHFAWTGIAVCIPTYLFIGSMHTDTGLNFWTHIKRVIFAKLGEWLAAFLALFRYEPEWARVHAAMEAEEAAKRESLFGSSPMKRTSSVTRAAMSARMRQGTATEDTLSPTLSRFDSRERYIPRPHLTSGDARHSIDHNNSPSRQRTAGIAFSIDKSARVHDVEPKEEANSVSPRTGSPRRSGDDAWEGDRAQNTAVAPRKGRAWSFFGRLWQNRDTDDHGKPPVRRPSV